LVSGCGMLRICGLLLLLSVLLLLLLVEAGGRVRRIIPSGSARSKCVTALFLRTDTIERVFETVSSLWVVVLFTRVRPAGTNHRFSMLFTQTTPHFLSGIQKKLRIQQYFTSESVLPLFVIYILLSYCSVVRILLILVGTISCACVSSVSISHAISLLYTKICSNLRAATSFVGDSR